jgi:transposase
MERAMKVQEVILRAMSGQIKWFQAAEILGMSARSMRRWRWRLEQHGYDGLFDRRTQRPSPRRVAVEIIEHVLRLYREEYFDFNVKHFHEKLLSEHGIALSYSWVKNALQTAGLVARRRKRGRHHKRRLRRPLPGMMLHIDGSTHGWLGPEQGKQDLITLMDDASSEIYYAQLVDQESTATVMAGIKAVIETKGLFCSLYSDRASHFFHTPKAGGAPDRSVRTQVGRALEQLGIEAIPAGSPQARGRCERSYRTLQGRLPQELRRRGITTMAAANEFLRTEYLDAHNALFTVAAQAEGTAFVPYAGCELDKIFSRHNERMVGNDNTVTLGKLAFQLERQTFRFSMAKCRALVCEHLDGTFSIWYGPNLLGRYHSTGQLMGEQQREEDRGLMEKWKTLPVSHFPTGLTTTNQNRTDHLL